MNATPLTDLDDYFLGARLLAPLKKPWLDVYDNVEQHASPGAIPGIMAEALSTLDLVGPSLEVNREKTQSRDINYTGVQVCMGGGLPPCSKQIPAFQWEPQHEYRGLRHLIAWRRFGNPEDLFFAQCAVSRVVHEPTLYDVPKNQREVGWPLLLLTESLSLPTLMDGTLTSIDKLTTLLWSTHGDNYLTLNTAAGTDHGNLPVCSWQHAILTKALGRLVRRKYPDPRVAVLYKAGVKGLDAMRQPNSWSWWKDWDPFTGHHLDAVSLYAGTSLWTLAAYAETLGVVESAAPMRKEVVQQFVAYSDAMTTTDKNYDPGVHALVVALLK